jgi:hypothetical protein
MLTKFASSFFKTSLFYRSSRSFACHTVDKNDATQNLLESVTSTIKGITHINYIEEHDPNLPEEEKAKMKRFLIYRSNPAVREKI